MLRRFSATAAMVAMTVAGTGSAMAFDDPAFERAVNAVQTRMAPIDAQEGRIPGRALVFVDADGNTTVDVRGVADIESGRAADKDTPFYIASMTKAFVGLMAVRLDMDGVLPLDTSLAEIYPGMRVEGVDLAQVTLRDALSHKLGFNSPALSWRTSYSDAVPVDDFAAVVNASQKPTDAAFSYANMGYLLYAGAVERRTGRSWKAWLDELVLHPLGMRHSSARSSDLPQVSNTHEIYDTGWRSYAPKPDAVSHAAGGLFVSGADMAQWLAANAGVVSAIGRDAISAAQKQQAELSRERGPVACTGYALGWSICEAAGIRFLEHGGTYTGARSEMIVLPDHGVGFAAMFNSDSMTGGLGFELLTMFVLAYAGQDAELPSPEAFGARYAERADGYREHRSKQEAAIPDTGFVPEPEDLASYRGTYVSDGLGRLELVVDETGLTGRLNGMPLVLKTMARDHFIARISTAGGAQDFKLLRADGGEITAVEWSGDLFDKR